MTNKDVRRAQARLGRLIDPGARAAEVGDRLDITAEERSDEVRSRLELMFRTRPGLTAVVIRLDGQDIGIATPSRLVATAGTAGDQPEFGGSDRATLPGLSQQFKAIRFVCAVPACDRSSILSYYDPRALPVCDVAGHGTMGLRR
ncbi:hypothetical protein ACIGZJ_14520 [Kitasatospora sp. NPDC052868]|uniref:hypothetical protein n=1 Tax=Kitasatospora sp. NPDC052868 TaxID=3364060 RepID=UPI0037C89A3E